MSTTNIYKVQSNGDIVLHEEISNSWAGGMHVWTTLSKAHGFDDTLLTGFSQIFKLFNNKSKKLKKWEWITIGTTSDRVWVQKKDFPEVIKAFRDYDSHYPNSNLPKQAQVIEKLQQDPDCIGVAWAQTSVCDDVWDYDWIENDDDTETLIPYNVFKGDEHWDLFEDRVELED